MSDTAGWAVPGVPFPRPAVEQTPDLLALQQAVEQALAVDPALLAGPDALDRTRVLLLLVERLQAAALDGVADVDARALWEHAAAGSTRTWLRTLPCGDRGQLADARSLVGAPLLRAAVHDGTVALRSATALARSLARLPDHVPDDQLHATLVDGTAEVLRTWCGAADLTPDDARQATWTARRDQMTQTVKTALAAGCWGSPADALEPVAVLLAHALPPTDAHTALDLLVDALQPEADLDAQGEQEYRTRDLVLRKLKGGGWSLRGHLTDQTGQLLHSELQARERQARGQHDGPDGQAGGDAATSGSPDGALGRGSDDGEGAGDHADADDPARSGAAGPGVPPLAPRDKPPGQRHGHPPTEGPAGATPGQRTHDALAVLLADLAAITPGSGRPSPATLLIVATLEALERRPGAPPATLKTPRGSVPLTPAALARHGCSAQLTAVLLDAHRRPVGASGEHRHATARERRAMTAAWGTDCAVNGCGHPGPVPHHVDPFAASHQTSQQDLVPFCDHHHSDVHDGHKTLRLRDGRLLDQHGWIHPDWS